MCTSDFFGIGWTDGPKRMEELKNQIEIIADVIHEILSSAFIAWCMLLACDSSQR